MGGPTVGSISISLSLFPKMLRRRRSSKKKLLWFLWEREKEEKRRERQSDKLAAGTLIMAA